VVLLEKAGYEEVAKRSQRQLRRGQVTSITSNKTVSLLQKYYDLRLMKLGVSAEAAEAIAGGNNFILAKKRAAAWPLQYQGPTILLQLIL